MLQSNIRWNLLLVTMLLVCLSTADEYVFKSASKSKPFVKRYDTQPFSPENITVSTAPTLSSNIKWSTFDERKKNMSTSCELMSNDSSYCQKYTYTECHKYMKSKNLSISRACVNGITPSSQHIKEFFGSLKSPFKGDEDCTEIEKWIVCSVIYPECNLTSTRIKLPCKDICTRGEAHACRPATLHRFHKLQRLIFSRRFIPSCEDLPSRDDDSGCDFPQFIAEILDRNEDKYTWKTNMYIGIGIGIVALLLIAIFTSVYFHRKKKRYMHTRAMSLQEIHTIHRDVGNPNRNEGLFDDSWQAYGTLDMLINERGINRFARENLVYQEYLGEGEFGKVVQCSTPTQHSTDITLVAVKYLKDDASDALETNFLEEVKILSQFKHPNVIPLLGVCVDSHGPKCIVLEFMKYGDLNQYIRARSGCYYALAGCHGNVPEEIEYRSPEISFHKLLFIANQVAGGVSYLATKRFVHRDLATRNILVGDDMHVKIADFGMARDIYGSDYYRVDSKRMLPLRWLSPEALTLGKFTIYSDIWAFGVLLWELFTYGMQPFGGYSNEEICDQIRCHKLLEKPYGCPKQVFELIKSCWKFEPTNRKSCSSVKDTITKWLEGEEQFIEMAWKHLLFRPLTTRAKLTKNRRYFSTSTMHEGEIIL